MLELLILIALVGSIIAGIWDLLTTEVPDEIPALMITSGLLIHFIDAGITGNFFTLYMSLLVGTSLLLIGLIMYNKGQWGGADAWILAAIGYLVPIYNNSIFMSDYIFNFLIVSAAYMIIYALIIGLKNRTVMNQFKKELAEKWKYVIGVPVAYGIFLLVVYNFFIISSGRAYAVNFYPMLYTLVLISFLTLFWVYGKTIEKYAFRRKIPVSKLRPGDVLDKMLWRGLTEEEVAEIRKKHKFVVIKEGVRFVPVFPVTLAVTLLFGNILFWLIF